MEPARWRWAVPFVKDTLSFSIFTIGTIGGVLGVAVAADMPAFPGYFEPEWSRVTGCALIGFVGLLGSIVGLRNRRQASALLLLAAPVAGGCFAWWLRHSDYNPRISVTHILLIFVVASLPLSILGTFWFVTSSAGWGPVLQMPALSRRRFQVFLGTAVFALFVLAAIYLSFYLPKTGWGDCRGYPTLSVRRFPDQTVFTAKVAFAGGTSDNPGFDRWSLMRVRQRFWGLPWWAPNFVIMRGLLKVEKGEYLVDARRSQGLLTHFLPLVEQYPCCHTQTIDRAAADLRALKDGPPKSGVRIIGTVYTDMFVTSEPARNVEVVVTGPRGSTSTTTDQQGIYDLVGLPEGHYSIVVNADDYFFHMAEVDLKSGQVWGTTLIARPPKAPAR